MSNEELLSLQLGLAFLLLKKWLMEKKKTLHIRLLKLFLIILKNN
jgi:hypothetical protein